MKTFVPSKQNIIKFVLFISIAALSSIQAQAQSSNDLNAEISTANKIQSVKLASFTAVYNNGKADLKWETASEINVSHFVIEKSIDGNNYSDAGVFFAYGNATGKTNYSFADKLATRQAAVVYYRLYVAYNNGKGQYSETCIIKTAK